MSLTTRRYALAVGAVEWIMLLTFFFMSVAVGLYGLAHYDDMVQLLMDLYKERNQTLSTEQAKYLLDILLGIATVVLIMACALSAGINYLLWSGIKKENLWRVSGWWWMNSVFLVIAMLVSLKTLMRDGQIDYFGLIGIIYRIVSLYFVKQYVNELSKPLLPAVSKSNQFKKQPLKEDLA